MTKTRLIKKIELPILKNFIKKNHKEKHIMVGSNKIYKFYFLNGSSKMNFVGTFEKKKLISILGIIKNRQWDPKLKNDIQLSMWFNKKNVKTSGLENMLFVLNQYKHSSIYTTGLNEKTSMKVYKLFSQIREFKHFFLPNSFLKKKICKTKRKVNIDNKSDNLKVLKKIYKINNLPKYSYFPKKSIEFFNSKYGQNPFYKYYFLEMYYKKEIKLFFVCKDIYLSKQKVTISRIVDFYGDFPKNISFKNEILSYLINNKIEYLDFLIFAQKSDLLNKQGFLLKNKDEIVPNYFEPFVKKNIKIRIAIIKNYYKNKLIIVKADGDQERKG